MKSVRQLRYEAGGLFDHRVDRPLRKLFEYYPGLPSCLYYEPHDALWQNVAGRIEMGWDINHGL